ncbi:MAG: aldo/keto reductase [Kiritimatiellae bacterium]|nr:aldo/keto reductase [Kiritimatiellia bacterium]
MNPNLQWSRRRFLTQTAALAATSAAAAAASRRTATDLVPLGTTGLRISRLGMGTGSNGGRVQFDLGQSAFNDLVRYAFERGITYFDCAKSYRTLPWIAEAIAPLPREKIFLLTKIGGKPEKPAEEIENLLRVYRTDYLDCLLVHCQVTHTWTDDQKRLMDAIDEAQSKRRVLCKGVSCHALPALKVAAESEWVQVNLVRINPQARHIDGPTPRWDAQGTDIAPVLEQLRVMRRNGHGVIGMKIIGNGDFRDPADREKSIRFAMSLPEVDAITIGFKSRAEIDEAIERMNRALAEST